MSLTTTYDILLPYLLFRVYDPATQSIGLSQGAKVLLRDSNLNSATVTVPTRPGLELELYIRGKGATSSDAKAAGTCSLLRRVILQAKSS
jgi:hypothetical protein